jgi:hypothetical protein
MEVLKVKESGCKRRREARAPLLRLYSEWELKSRERISLVLCKVGRVFLEYAVSLGLGGAFPFHLFRTLFPQGC